MKPEALTERDYIDVIGTTFETDGDRHQRWFNEYDKSARFHAARRLLRNVRSAGRMLDLGCSTGAWHEFWAERGWPSVVGVDLSLERVTAAAQRDYLGVSAAGERLPFADRSFDFVASVDMLVHVLQPSDRFAVFREVHRVLKPGGAFFFSLALARGYGKNPGVDGYCNYSSDEEAQRLAIGTGFTFGDSRSIEFFAFFRPWQFFGRIPRPVFYRGLSSPTDRLLGGSVLRQFGRVMFYLVENSSSG